MARTIANKPDSPNRALIQTFLTSQQALLLVLGSNESEKSDLLTEVVKSSRASQQIIRLKGSSSIKPSQLIALLSKNWDAVISDDSYNLKKQLEAILNHISNNHFSCLLVIDEADQLSYSLMAAICYLANLQENRKTCLHIILSGEFSLNDKINNYEIKKPPFLRLDELPKKNFIPNPFKKHAIKSFSIVALILFTFFIHWFDQKGHHYFKIPGYDMRSFSEKKPATTSTLVAKNVPAESNIIKPSENPTKPIAVTKVAAPKPISKKKEYIIQLMSDPNKEVLASFVDEYHIADHVKIIQNYFHHHNWYLLAYGEYSSYQQAKSALLKLPKSLKTLHPWIRPLR